MSDVTVIGLGLMGSALARALIKGGHRVTVWNRSSAKAHPLIELGAAGCANLAAAVEASPVVLVCIDSYQTTQAMFAAADVGAKLPGRAIVQLSTGSPQEARDSEAWFTAHGANYLDGAILAGPDAIGTPDATILYAGRRQVFDRCEALLKSLGEDLRFVGEKVGSAAALDLAWLSKLYGMFAGAAHGTILCEAEGIDLGLYSSVFAPNDSASWMIDVIRADAFRNPGATLAVWNAALLRIRDHAKDMKINHEVPDFVAGILGRAIAAGHGDEHIAAMVKVLRATSR